MIEVKEGGLICSSDQFEGYNSPHIDLIQEIKYDSIAKLPTEIKDKIKKKIGEYLIDPLYDYDCELDIQDDLEYIIEGWGVIINDNNTEYITVENDFWLVHKRINHNIFDLMERRRHAFFNGIGLGNCNRKLLSLKIPTDVARLLFEGIKV